MTDSKSSSTTPPEWGDDLLARFFADAASNERATAANYPTAFALLRQLHEAFLRAEQMGEKGSAYSTVIPRVLLARAHSAFLASARLALGTQPTEAQILLRSVIEQGWYAVHVATDPAPTKRVEIWLRRHESAAAEARSKQEFSVANVRGSHAGVDPRAAEEVHALYETLIDFGAHPNERGVLTSIKKVEDFEINEYQVAILQGDSLRVMMAVKLTITVASAVVGMFRHIYPERFVLIGLDSSLDHINRETESFFRRFIQERRARRGEAPL
jgi:hypothetical protein